MKEKIINPNSAIRPAKDSPRRFAETVRWGSSDGIICTSHAPAIGRHARDTGRRFRSNLVTLEEA